MTDLSDHRLEDELLDAVFGGNAVGYGDGCSHCGNCVYDCPTHAITLGADGPIINSSECILCFTCVSSCYVFYEILS